MALRYVLVVLPFLLETTMPANANDDVAWGRMICEVVGSRIISEDGTHPEPASRPNESFLKGTEFDFEYGVDDALGLTIHLRETANRNVLINETFPMKSFSSISQVTNIAEFRAPYSEATFGQHRMNYKGSDQLFLKNQCGGKEWSGHLVRTHVGGLSTHVVSLKCRTFVDARDEVFARLSTAQRARSPN
ncbi:hypothetical protein [Ovoidimarina sediminis]|uniref:hypothetical protein n=1 Tax=Ovoidimarina sediminis TaxID=3079856 RepID=UPI0029115303|nr:hypothetical protein [Rhodophyticola sp. MJ-SS7]MDU8945771.1 hypothetical protein [Rhodophyticola sp. MJ-SS7]